MQSRPQRDCATIADASILLDKWQNTCYKCDNNIGQAAAGMRRWTNKPIPAPPLVEKLLEFRAVFGVKGENAITSRPSTYVEKTSEKRGKMASECNFTRLLV